MLSGFGGIGAINQMDAQAGGKKPDDNGGSAFLIGLMLGMVAYIVAAWVLNHVRFV